MKHHIFAISQTGSGHLLTGPERSFAPCQDAYQVLSVPSAKVPAWTSAMECHMIAVADGHGNLTRHGSSEFGSRFAVEAAVDTMVQLAGDYEKCHDTEVFLQFPQRVTELWREKVLSHALTRFPEPDLRTRFRNEEEYQTYVQKIMNAYGTTLLTVVAIPEKKLLISAQIGDGDIVFLSKNAVPQEPVKLVYGNRRHVYGGNVTDSLCNPDALQRFEMSILDGNKDEEAAKWLEDYVLIAATDGISGAALSERKFMNDYCGPRLRAYMDAKNEEERTWVRERMEDEMRKEMTYYSMDDMTCVMMAVNDRTEVRTDRNRTRKYDYEEMLGETVYRESKIARDRKESDDYLTILDLTRKNAVNEDGGGRNDK